MFIAAGVILAPVHMPFTLADVNRAFEKSALKN